MIVLKYLQSRFKYISPWLPFPVLIIESDDWGFCRVPSKRRKEDIIKVNPQRALNPYIRYDGLETQEDLSILFNILSDIKDCDGNSSVITANFIMKNPDFKKIKESGFSVFFGEHFYDTYIKIHGNDESFRLQKQGLSERLFVPQFHGLYHVNIKRWMQSLRNGDSSTLSSFNSQMISYQFRENKAGISCVDFFLDAMNPASHGELVEIIRSNKEGLTLFEKTWGFKSRTIIAPCYIWHRNMEAELKNEGVLAFQGQRLQSESKLMHDPNDLRRVYHYQGEKNAFGQIYLLREAFFEPSLNQREDFVNTAFQQVDKSLKRQGFSILCTHRLNFMGNIEKENRENNLRKFKELLIKIKYKWPDIRFVSTDQLVQYYLYQSSIR